MDIITNRENFKKLAYYINAGILMFVIGMGIFFTVYHVTFLSYYSIPLYVFYVVAFFIIKANKLTEYVIAIYTLIIAYMCICTMCLGYNYGFHLYCMSLISVIFVTEYMAYKVNNRKPKAVFISIATAVLYLASTLFTIIHGPFYAINDTVATICLIVNSVTVFFFLIFYNRLLISLVIHSEDKLVEMAHMDRLTNLYNRHYLIDYMKSMEEHFSNRSWLAIADIDNFKHINDTYGHNCGDYVLQHLSELMKNTCKDCMLCRWGGEEFLIVGKTSESDSNILEKLRKTVEGESFVFEDSKIPVTITIGESDFSSDLSFSEWLQIADKNLYYGKNSGKNKVVYKLPE